jgi:hypothetical protein
MAPRDRTPEDGEATISWASIAVPFVASFSVLGVMLYLVRGLPAGHPVFDTRFGFDSKDVHAAMAAYTADNIRAHILAGACVCWPAGAWPGRPAGRAPGGACRPHIRPRTS